MTSDRSYRPRFTLEKALDEIRRCSGTQFDPAIAEAFLNVFETHDLSEIEAGANTKFNRENM